MSSLLSVLHWLGMSPMSVLLRNASKNIRGFKISWQRGHLFPVKIYENIPDLLIFETIKPITYLLWKLVNCGKG